MPQIDFVQAALEQEVEPEQNQTPDIDFVDLATKAANSEEMKDLSPVDQAIAAGEPVTPDSAGFVANLGAGLAEDTQSDIDIYAKIVFPDTPLEVSRRRFSEVDGKILYVDEQGKLKNPGAGIRAGVSRFLGDAGLNIVGGIAGGVGGTPILGGALGAAAGEGVKNILRGALFGETMTTGEFALASGKEFAIDATFGKLFDLGAAALRTRALRNIDEIDESVVKETQERIFNETGIRVDLAQLVGGTQLRRLKIFISKNPGQAQDLISAFDDMQRGQVEGAVERIVKLVAGGDTATLEALGTRGINAAQASIALAKQMRREATSDLYTEAYESASSINISAVASYLDEQIRVAKGPVLKALKSARKMLNAKEKVDGKAVLDTSLEGLHSSMIAIDAMIDGARRGDTSVSGRTLNYLVETNKMLRETLEEVSPEFARVQGIYRQLTRELVQPLEDSIVGALSKVTNEKAASASAKLFSGSLIQSPKNMRLARLAIQQVERRFPEFAGAWDGLVAQYLKNVSDTALTNTMTGDAASLANRFRKSIAATPRQRAVLREAFGAGREGTERMRLFDSTMEALDMVARTPLSASDTQGFQAIMESLKSGLARVGMFVVSPLDSTKSLITEMNMEKALVQAAEAIMDPNKAAALKALRSMRPNFERNVAIMGVLTGTLAISSLENLLEVDE